MTLKLKRGTKAQIVASAGAGTLAPYEPMWTTDAKEMIVALTASTYAVVGASEIGPGLVGSAVTSVVIAIPASGEILDVSGVFKAQSAGRLGWRPSFDGGSTYLSSSVYTSEWLFAYNNTFGAVTQALNFGLLSDTPYPPYRDFWPMHVNAQINVGSASLAPGSLTVFAGPNENGSGLPQQGVVGTRIANPIGRPTHIMILSSVSGGIAAGSYFSARMR